MRLFKKMGLALACAASMTIGGSGAWADDDEKKAPYVEVVIPIELQNDYNFKSDTRAARGNDLFTTTEPEITVGIWRGLTFYAHAVLEPVRDRRPNDDRFFGDHGFYLQDIWLAYEGSLYEGDGPVSNVGFRIFGGKFTPNFGLAWDITPGVYGTDFAEDYEFSERWGFGGSFTIKHGALGEYKISGSTFFLDTTVLSNSAITERGRTRLRDGGPSNTENLKSFALALDGSEIPGLEGFSYHIGFIHQAVRGGPDEQGFVASAQWEIPLGGDWKITPLVEYAHFWDADGTAGARRHFLTTSLAAEHGNWSASISHTLRNTTSPGESTIRDNLFTVSGGYTFDNGLGIELGYSFRNEESVGTHTIGVLVTYELSFGLGGK